MIDWAEVRNRFPAVEPVTYLNTAAGGPISKAAAEAGADYYECTYRDGDVHWDEWLERVEAVRESTAHLLGAATREIGFVSNASIGMSHVAGMLRGDGDTAPFRGEVLAVRDEFPSITLPWLQLGYRVRFVEAGSDGGVDIQRLADSLSPESRVLALGLVHYRTGFRYQLEELRRLARERDLLLVLDATQGLGAVPVDLSAGEVDFMVTSGYKWLNAGYGVGVIYVNQRHLAAERLPAAGWRSAADPYALIADRLELEASARALELGHPPFAGVFSLGAAVDLIRSIGPAAIEDRVLMLAAKVTEELRAAGYAPVQAASRCNRSGIVYLPLPDAGERKRALDAAGVLVSQRGDGLRISTHFYNRRADVEQLVHCLG